jgi:phage baseplate assembly protein W
MATVRFPFQIIDGKVSTTSVEAEEMRSKVLFCLGTQVNERVMRPSWGIDILSTVYAVGGDLTIAVPEAIQMAFQKWFPSVRLIEAKVYEKPDDPTRFTVDVRFGVINSDIDEVARIELPVTEGA